ncbi:unnamed protein product [Discula destructiva]
MRLLDEYDRYDGDPPERLVWEQLDFVRRRYLPGLAVEVSLAENPGKIVEYCKIKKALEALADPHNLLPQDVRVEAERLYKEFDKKKWYESQPILTTPTWQLTSGRYPTEDHPIFGRLCIMDGLIIGQGPGRNARPRIDDRRRVRNAKEYGHNGLEPGFWTPFQVGLILHGGHDQPQRGISGDEKYGAYPIVVSGQYNDIDLNEGNAIYYSAEGARHKQASKKAGAKANEAMRASIRTWNPIRVYRSAKHCGPYAPPCGIRYDGLYECVGKEIRVNKDGGSYERFKLVRLNRSDQPDLDDIVGVSPTAKQTEDYRRLKVESGY